MTDLEREELLLLDGARRAIEPSHLDVARVLQETRLAIAAGIAVGGAAAGASLWAKHGSSVGALLKANALPKLIVALSIAGAGAVGYGLGYERAQKHVPVRAQASVHVEPSVGGSGPGMEPPGGAQPVAVEHRSGSALPPAPPTAPAMAASLLDHAPKPRADAGTRRKSPKPSTPALDATPDTSVQQADTLASPASLTAELAALRRIERALREHEPERALSLLDRLDTEVPDGRLLEERTAARTMARCTTGTKSERDAMQHVLEFSRVYPASVYFARVRNTCLPPPTDSERR